jgi:hypothetical protein
MDNQTLLLVCVALGVSAYVLYKCKNNNAEMYHLKPMPRYCPQDHQWCDFVHTCVPKGKCVDFCTLQGKVWCQRQHGCVGIGERC